jgi:hypothetical protein
MLSRVASQFDAFNDSATLRRASTRGFKGSTAGSFLASSSHERCSSQHRSTASSTGEPLLDGEGSVRDLPVRGRFRFGYLAQYFVVGLIYGGLPATTYGFLLGYLNVPAYVYSASHSVLTLPWSFKFVFGAVSDCLPVCGYRRKPYMVAGWLLCTLMLVLLFLWPLPAPFYCVDPLTGDYLLEQPPCNPEAAHAGEAPTLLMMGACIGYVLADVAADGLTVQYARSESDDHRGYTQSTAFLWRSLGQVVACCLVGFGMSGKLYLGSFEASMSFNQVCLVFACASCAMVPISLTCIHEDLLRERTSLAQYRAATWSLLKSKAFFFVVLWQLLNPAIQYVHSTAYPLLKRYWAGVQALPNQVSAVVSYMIFSCAVWVVRERFLHASWRKMLCATTLVLVALDAPFALLTTFGVVRNQYFYLSNNLVTYAPGAVFVVVGCFVIVELTTDGNEGLVYGLLSTVNNCGQSVPSAISNVLFGSSMFTPALSSSANYNPLKGGDQPCFRRVVATSLCVGYAFAVASLVTMPLMPSQKADARRRMRTWPRHTAYAVATLVLLALGLGYSLTANLLALTPLGCLRIVGGHGCDANFTDVAEPC